MRREERKLLMPAKFLPRLDGQDFNLASKYLPHTESEELTTTPMINEEDRDRERGSEAFCSEFYW